MRMNDGERHLTVEPYSPTLGGHFWWGLSDAGDIQGVLRNREPVWFEWAMLALSLLIVIWIAFVR